MGQLKYRRVLLKLSGESLLGERSYGLDTRALKTVAQQIKSVHQSGLELAIVIGGGNIFRGMAASSKGMDRTTADYIGMLATVINSMALQEALETAGVSTRVLSAIEMSELTEPYIRRRATRHLEKGRIVIFAAGTGNPYFTTDTAASLRAAEINAEVILKATKVDGVFDKDPVKNKDAKKFETLSYLDIINGQLRVMDSTAATLCMENNLPIIVFNMHQEGILQRAVEGESVGTIIKRS